jgi:vitamin B12/bleomycin/antimicrobial peptide transport system ATP-binding/permease protein
VALARLLLVHPRYAFLDEPVSALDPGRGRALYELLARSPITYISTAGDLSLLEYHDDLLELRPNGAWRLTLGHPEAA